MMVADLHCDLLSYLAGNERRSPYDEDSRCGISQFKQGNVVYQTLAIYSHTSKKSVASAEKQFTVFQTLPKLYSEEFTRLDTLHIPEPTGKIHIAAAIENASCLCSETEHLSYCFTRFDRYRMTAGPIVYISLTWNQTNRFGGGNLGKKGLKRDGELLLEYLSGTKIAIDLSHTSDALAEDVLNYIDKKGLKIVPIASHSNFRAIADMPRNLPDHLAKEILARGGIIGLNLFKPFVGKSFPEDFRRQVDYARSLGAFDQFCFGADFFYDKDLPASLYPFPFYYEPFSNAACYPDLIHYLNDVFTKQELEKIAYKNLDAFFKRNPA